HAFARSGDHECQRAAVTMFRSAALLTEDESSQLIPQFFDLCGIFRRAKALGQIEESLLFLLLGFDALLNELYQDAVVAQAAALREPINLPGDLNWKAHATTDVFACRHGTSIHHCGAYLPICGNPEKGAHPAFSEGPDGKWDLGLVCEWNQEDGRNLGGK